MVLVCFPLCKTAKDLSSHYKSFTLLRLVVLLMWGLVQYLTAKHYLKRTGREVKGKIRGVIFLTSGLVHVCEWFASQEQIKSCGSRPGFLSVVSRAGWNRWQHGHFTHFIWLCEAHSEFHMMWMGLCRHILQKFGSSRRLVKDKPPPPQGHKYQGSTLRFNNQPVL